MGPRPFWQSAAALVVGLVVGASLVWGTIAGATPSPTCSPPASGNTPLGSAFAIGPAQEQVRGTDHWYNFTIESVAGDLAFRNLEFSVDTSTGGTIPPGGAWTLNVVNTSGEPIAQYSLTGTTAGNWTSGGDQAVLNNVVIVLLTAPQNLSSQGNTLLILFRGTDLAGCPSPSGSVDASIP